MPAAEGTSFRRDQTLAKSVEGTTTDERFGFTIRLTSGEEPYTDAAAPEGADDWTKTADGEYTFTLAHGESIKLLLPVGVEYEIVEEADGWQTAVAITDAAGEELENAAPEDAERTAKGTIEKESGSPTVTFRNAPEIVLPATGGAGVAGFAACGSMLLAFAALLWVIFLKKKRRAC